MPQNKQISTNDKISFILRNRKPEKQGLRRTKNFDPPLVGGGWLVHLLGWCTWLSWLKNLKYFATGLQIPFVDIITVQN